MIYLLPTKGSTRYRGEHPTNIRSVSAARGTVHLETQDGSRYIGRSTEFLDLPRYGQGITNFTRSGRLAPVVMTQHMYDTLLSVTRAARAVNWKSRAQAELLAKWDAAFAAKVQ